MSENKIILFLLIVALAVLPVLSQDGIMPFSDVSKGMTGVGKTVFSGTEVEDFDVEVIALLKNTGPGMNMILVEVSGGVLEETGVMAGMSGSPIYIDGKLIGALAYTWSFQKRALAGVTPIEELIDLDRRISSNRNLSSSEIYSLSSFLDGKSGNEKELFLKSMRTPGGGGTPILAPVVLCGFDSSFVYENEQDFNSIGLLPIQGGGGNGEESSSSVRLKPGDVIGAQLLRGDLNVTAYGTVTFVEGNKVFGFGHPFLAAGPVSFPMVKGQIDALLPSTNISTKMGSTVAVAGTITKDGSTGIMGIMGEGPAMIPVRVGITREGMRAEHFSFDSVVHELMTPGLVGAAVKNIVSTNQKRSGYQTIKVEGTIKLAELDDIKISDVYTGNNAARGISSLLTAYLNILFNSGLEVPEIEGISLFLDYSDRVSAAGIDDVWIRETKVKSGEKVDVKLFLKPFRGKIIKKLMTITVPAGLQGEKVLLRIGDAMTINRFDVPRSSYFPLSMEELIRILNHQRTNNHLYLTLSVNKPGYFVGGKGIGCLPPSKGTLIDSDKRGRKNGTASTATVFETEMATDFVIYGYHQFWLEVN